MSAASSVVTLLSALHLDDRPPPKVLNDETVSPGTIGSIVMGIIIVLVVLLLRSFFKQLKKVPPSFEEDAAGPDASVARTASEPDVVDPTGVVRPGDS